MLHHLALTVTSLEKSIPFYDAVLGALGYERHLTLPHIAAWEGAEPEILLYAAKGDQIGNVHRLYDPGIHHLAFQAEARDTVRRVAEIVDSLEGITLEGPKEFPDYSESYFAVFFLDPDGIKIEVMTIQKSREV